MADPKAPEMPTEQWAVECCHVIGDGADYLEPRVLQQLVRTKLAMQGLAIVSEADRKVLEAMAAGKDCWVRSMAESVEGPAEWADWFRSALQAELARRSGT